MKKTYSKPEFEVIDINHLGYVMDNAATFQAGSPLRQARASKGNDEVTAAKFNASAAEERWESLCGWDWDE